MRKLFLEIAILQAILFVLLEFATKRKIFKDDLPMKLLKTTNISLWLFSLCVGYGIIK